MSDISKTDTRTAAIQMETDGIKFYSDLAAKTLHPMGKAMFKSFAEDEKSHAKRLRALLSNDKEASPSGEKDTAHPGERVVTIFQKMGRELKHKVDVNTNDIEAVRLAMKMEESGTKFYEQAAKDARNTKDAETYRFLANEEKIHCAILKNTLECLENAEKWEAEKEGRIYDVWMNMINKKI
ncbi:MAG: rubrerythrin subfamily [Candidatus Brocadiaceae bacterium]|nr:rubrerythrin subfamily [Candidatus Brocadiaceae bacterium]